MNSQLPDIDVLMTMAKDDPQGLEDLRQRLSLELVEQAPKPYQKRLNGMIFQMDMERRRCNNPMQLCIKASQMMMDSFYQLQQSIEQLNQESSSIAQPFSNSPNNPSIQTDNILEFKQNV